MSRSLNRPNADKPTEPAIADVPSTPITKDEPTNSDHDGEPAELDATSESPVYPPGVQMVDAGKPLQPTPMPGTEIEPDPKAPPPGWKGSYERCGACGDFLGLAKVCPKCGPGAVPDNVSMSGIPKVVAQ